MMRGFGSDNHAPAHPLILKALLDVGKEHAPSYGTDPLSNACEEEFQKLFESQKLKCFFVLNGTGANVIALRALVKPWQSVLCTDTSHIHVDECGAPEAAGGFKLQAIPHKNGKLTTLELEKAFIRRGDQHFSQAAAVSITQPTELGTCYSEKEFSEICQWAKAKNLKIHVDGARIANAIVSLQTSFAQHITKNQVDILSFGGTKNGLLMGEVVVSFDSSLTQDLRFIRKQTSQLPSKSRYIAAQFQAYLKDGLWKKIAAQSCARAQELYQKISEVNPKLCEEPPTSNAVFVKLRPEWLRALREISFFYVWDEKEHLCRLMTSWDTGQDEIENFVQKLKELSQ